MNQTMKSAAHDRLQTLVADHPLLWQGHRINPHDATAYRSTGHDTLDTILPGRGWPRRALTDIIAPSWGIGELQLLMPAMREATQNKQWVVWVAPPFMPYAPALAQAQVDLDYVLIIHAEQHSQNALWSMEKALQNKACTMVLAWLNWLPNAVLRRLQLAAESGHTSGFMFRNHAAKHSPAALQLSLTAAQDTLQVHVTKARGTSGQRHTHLLRH